MQEFTERFFPSKICICGHTADEHELLLGGSRGRCKHGHGVYPGPNECKCLMFREKAKEEYRRNELKKDIANVMRNL